MTAPPKKLKDLKYPLLSQKTYTHQEGVLPAQTSQSGPPRGSTTGQKQKLNMQIKYQKFKKIINKHNAGMT